MSQRTVNFRRGEQLVERVNLADITTSHNPRRPERALQEALADEGYEGWTLLDLVHNLAQSDNVDDRVRFVELVEKYCSQERGLVELAASRRDAEIEPVLLRSFRAKVGEEYVQRYGIVVGERRVLAAAYNHAKHHTPATVGAVSKKLTVEQAEDLAFDENYQRKDMTAVEIGKGLVRKFERRKLAYTGEGEYTVKQFAEDEGKDYQFCRRRMALTNLSDDEQAKVESGEVNLTEACEVGIRRGKKSKPDSTPQTPQDGPKLVEDEQPTDSDEGQQEGSETPANEEIPPRQQGRRRVKTLAQLQDAFDAEVRKGDRGNDDFLRGLAYAMNYVNDRGTPLLAEAKKSKLEVNPIDGPTVAKLIRNLYQLDPGLVARLRELLLPKKG